MALGISDAIELTKRIAELVKATATLELKEKITDLREAVLNAKDEVLTLREENQQLKTQAQDSTDTAARLAKYTLVKSPGGALVYRSEAPPPHYACPRCFEERKIHILQQGGSADGWCPQCDKSFEIAVELPMSPMHHHSDYDPFSRP